MYMKKGAGQMYHDGDYPEVGSAGPDTQGQYPEHYTAPTPVQAQGQAPYAYGQDGPLGGQSPSSAASQPGKGTFCGMTKRAFIGVAAMTAVLLGLVIGLGAGLGAKLSKTNSELAAAQAELATATSSSPSATSTSTASSSTVSATADAAIPCPAANNTLYTSTAHNDTRFELHCGMDFSGGDEADDLTSLYTASMDDCMDECAATDACQGVGWGSTGTVSSEYLCYLKTNMTQSHAAEAAWCFGVNLNLTTVD